MTVDRIKRTDPSTDFYHPLRFGEYTSAAKENPQYPPTATPDPAQNVTNTPTRTPVEDDEGYELTGIGYEKAARYAGNTLRRMVTSRDEPVSETILETNRVAMTREYLTDAMREIRNAGEEVSFEALLDQATMVHDLVEHGDERYVISGTASNPVYTVVDDADIIAQVW
jgi:hypothetical protein